MAKNYRSNLFLTN